MDGLQGNVGGDHTDHAHDRDPHGLLDVADAERGESLNRPLDEQVLGKREAFLGDDSGDVGVIGLES